MSLVIMLYPTSSWTFYQKTSMTLHSFKITSINTLLFNLESITLKFGNKFFEVIRMIFFFNISTHKIHLSLFIIFLNFCLYQNIFEFA